MQSLPSYGPFLGLRDHAHTAVSVQMPNIAQLTLKEPFIAIRIVFHRLQANQCGHSAAVACKLQPIGHENEVCDLSPHIGGHVYLRSAHARTACHRCYCCRSLSALSILSSSGSLLSNHQMASAKSCPVSTPALQLVLVLSLKALLHVLDLKAHWVDAWCH